MNDKIIAREFTLSAKLFQSPPGKRMEPVQRAGNATEPLKRNVPPFDMSQFMQQHDACELLCPFRRLTWQNDNRAKNAKRHRDDRFRVQTQFD